LLCQGNTSSEISDLTAGSGNDTVTGNDTLTGVGTNDQLIGGVGDDTYIVKSASAAIVEQPDEGTDTAQVYVNGYTIGANVEIAYLQQGVAAVTGNDTGMTIHADTGTATTIIGGAGRDTLIGGDLADTLSGDGGNDMLRGGKGDDVLTGGPGNDIFAFARGDGNDTVHASATDGSDTVAFDAGVAHDQLWFAQSSNDLVVSVIGESQAITVAGWFASTNNQFGQISAGDGFTATAAAVDLLVQAMAAFSPAAARRDGPADRPCQQPGTHPGGQLAAQPAIPNSIQADRSRTTSSRRRAASPAYESRPRSGSMLLS
jgi:Ca2+-binding RTX toxin-like protein